MYERSALRTGDHVVGPAIVEQMDTTTVILPEHHAIVDDRLNLILEAIA